MYLAMALFFVAVMAVLLTPVFVGLFIERKAMRSSRRKSEAQDEQARHAAIMKHYADREEAKQKAFNQPDRKRRQLAADLLFPGMYLTWDCDEFGDRNAHMAVMNWIATSTYSLNDQRHQMLVAKAMELEGTGQ